MNVYNQIYFLNYSMFEELISDASNQSDVSEEESLSNISEEDMISEASSIIEEEDIMSVTSDDYLSDDPDANILDTNVNTNINPVSNKLVIHINPNMLNFMNHLYTISTEKNITFSKLFNNPLLESLNKKKTFDKKHSKISVDPYNLLIRQNKYNIKTDTYGWRLYNGIPINIHVTDEMILTKTNEEIFKLVMSELVYQKRKLKLTSKTIPSQAFNALGIDVSEYKC